MMGTAFAPGGRSRVVISIAWMYLLGALITLLLGVISIIVLSITRPQLDVMVVSAVVFAFCGSMYTAMCAAIKGQENQHKITELGYQVNGKLQKLLEETAQKNRLAGQLEGAALERHGVLITAPGPDVPPTPGDPHASDQRLGRDQTSR